MLCRMRDLFCGIIPFSNAGSLSQKARGVERIYRQLDKATETFRVKADLTCIKPCGECCLNSTVEASEIEMLPLAFELIRSSRADEWHKKAESAEMSGLCVLYSAEGERGHCVFYRWRPMVCRLFAFAGNRDKHGQPRLVTCGLIKKSFPQEVELVLERVYEGALIPPMMSDYVMRVASLDPDMSRETIPVNSALKRAIERVWINQKLSH